MSKQEFLDTLRRELSQLPQSEIERHIAYFSELIDDRIEDGMTEAQAVSVLGNPVEVAHELLLNTPFGVLVNQQVKKKGNGISIVAAILIVLGIPVWLPIALALAAVGFAIGIGFFAVILAIFVVILALGVSGVVGLVMGVISLFTRTMSGLFILGCALAAGGLSVIGIIFAVWLAKILIRFIAAVIREIKLWVIRKGKKNA